MKYDIRLRRTVAGCALALALSAFTAACREPSSGTAGAASGAGTSRADAATFYTGRTVSIVVGSGAGGGFDTTARLVARHIGKHIPGSPTVIVVNMPGGGGLVAANHIFNAAPKDGTVIGLFHEAQMMTQLTGGEGVQFDLRQFNWLGSSYVDPNVCLVRADAPVTTFAGMIGAASSITVGGTGPGSNTYDAPRVLAAATGASLKAVAGYPTTNDVRIGVERGELQGMCLGWESVQSASAQWLEDKYARVFVQNGIVRHRDLPDVPLALEFAKDEDSRRLLRLVDAPGAMAKPFSMPPGVDAALVGVMRDALQATYRDPALLQEAAAMHLDVQPKTAVDILRILDR
ncbi:MAG: Bug family tripartite tricarboxylate transporter substrate binding protein, partial [Vicinamibacterales bacterium]